MIKDDTNANTLDEIARSSFVICLDEKNPRGAEELAYHSLTGDANNRWFDKVLQIVVFANGRASLIGEHSPLDAAPVSEMVDWILLSLKNQQV